MADEELPELKALYDELWSDARTMIRDMKRSISIYLFAGLMTLGVSVIIIGTAISEWNKIVSGSASAFTYVYAVAGVVGTVFLVQFGVSLLFWYNKLKNRYARLVRLEKTIED